MLGVTFNEKHSYNDFSLILSKFEISPPTPKTYEVEIAGADGSIDLSEALTDDVKFKNRTMKLTFSYIGEQSDVLIKFTEIMNYLHGERMDIILDADPNFRYVGRVSVNTTESDVSIGKIVVTCNCEPYKYDFGDDWLWDPFDFENDVATDYCQISISGSDSVEVVGRRKHYVPTITCSEAMTVTFSGNTYNLKAGRNKVFEITIVEGVNTLLFSGTGTVDIDCKDGDL